MATTVERLCLPGGDFETRRTARGLGVTLAGFCELEIELAPWVRVTQRGDSSGFWDLTGGAHGADPFHLFLPAIEDRLEASGATARDAERLLLRARELLQRASLEGAARCDPAALEAALSFTPRYRFDLYTLMANDRTGRVLQASRSAPGVLIVIAAARLRDEPFASIGRNLLKDLCAGRRLDPMIDEATARLQRVGCVGFDPESDAGASPAVVPGHGHRHLIRRAGPEAPASLLLQPPPFPIVPEEIPREPLARWSWYKLAELHARRVPHAPPTPRAVRLAAFLSRHARVLGRAAKRHGGLRSIVDDLIWRGDRSEHAPGPRSDPAEVLERLARRRSDDEAFEHGRAAGEVEARGGYPEPPFPADQSADWEVWPITSLDELREEGRKQRNCALTWFDRVLLGESAFYSARLGPRRLTLVISRRPGGPWRLGQVVAYANAPATAVERRVLERWLAKVGAGQEAQVSGTARGDDAAPHRKCSHGAVFGAPVPNERGKPTGR